jgi:hypothetical protein
MRLAHPLARTKSPGGEVVQREWSEVLPTTTAQRLKPHLSREGALQQQVIQELGTLFAHRTLITGAQPMAEAAL